MSGAASTRASAHAEVRIREPAGERTFAGALTVGGEGAQVVVPGTGAGPALQIERRGGMWTAETVADAAARFDGRPFTGARDLRRGDVIALGEAQIAVTELTRTLLRLEVHHLVGNVTIAPVATVATLGTEGDEDVEIRVAPAVIGAAPETPVPAAVPARARRRSHPGRWLLAGAVLALLLVVLGLLGALEPVALDLQPADARVSTPGTLLSWHSGDRLLVLPGRHTVRATREGYRPAQTEVQVADGGSASVRLRLERLPGRIVIDTGGVAATVSVDGAEAGRAPGTIEVPAGSHTIALRAPRHLDFVTTLDVEGGGVRQDLAARLQPAWGTLKIASEPPGATVSIDGQPAGQAPAALEVDAGMRRVRLTAPGLKPWESSVVIKAGETLEIGPIRLGLPDARVTVRSRPSGAEVAVGGAFRGRTPVTVDLPPGMSHEIVVSLPGHAPWSRSIFAEAGARTSLDARLEPILADVRVTGTPADAELFVDGEPRGRTPATLRLTATEHRIEVRREGFLPFTTTVTPAAGLERTVEYRLTSADRAVALQESAPTITTKHGYVLRIVPPGTFTMGSERREQGRRDNEGFRKVTLKRPFYIGTTEVTNAQFRRFRPEHKSGFVGQQSFELDAQPVTRVSWEDAVAYCNWLSEQEGLPPAYQKNGGTYTLVRPVTIGYRLPTEAEWEYAARYAGPGRSLRFPWGDALPVAPAAGNIAGMETGNEVPARLESYRDEYPTIAPVAKHPPNALGLFDMSGNVSEWVGDIYLSFVDGADATDPLGPEQGNRHVIRGSNWQTAVVTGLRLAWRDTADGPSQTIGFRIARYAE